MKKEYNWGIIGLGNIADKFATALGSTTRGKLYAVASRSYEKAKYFSEKFGACRFYDTYDKLIEDDKIDIVYIATPHNLHYPITKKCLEYGRNVLCEKPVTINSSQFEELRELAYRKRLFYMDALWTRFLPKIEKTLEYLTADKLGEIRYLRADFGINPALNPQGRLLNPALGGGSILDIGIYPVFLSLLILGYPDEIKVSAVNSNTGVDVSCGIILKYKNGTIADLFSSFLVKSETSAEIAGTNGRIILHRQFLAPGDISFIPEIGEEIRHSFPARSNGYEYEAEEVMDCLDKCLLESPRLPLSFTSLLMKLLDEIRYLANVIYDEDKNHNSSLSQSGLT